MQGLEHMRIPAERRQRDCELAAQEDECKAALLAHLKASVSKAHFSTYEVLTRECTELEDSEEDLRRALQMALKDRVLQTLSQHVAGLRQSALDEVKKAESASLDRIQQKQQLTSDDEQVCSAA
jgi:hypothetical protein